MRGGTACPRRSALTPAVTSVGPVKDDAIAVREFVADDLDAVVAFSLRAWEPVFTSLHAVLGDEIFFRLHPDWRESQAEAVRSGCTNEERDAFVAVVDTQPVGFVAVALNAFHDRMGAIEIIGVDPDYQRTGVGATLTKVALDHMRDHDMDIAVVETGGDPGHAPARALYTTSGFTVLPIHATSSPCGNTALRPTAPALAAWVRCAGTAADV